MSKLDYYPVTAPELPGLTPEYFERRFNGAQALLRNRLNGLYVAAEDVRNGLLNPVRAQLEICRAIGSFTEIPLPTPIMSEAEGALGIPSDSELS